MQRLLGVVLIASCTHALAPAGEPRLRAFLVARAAHEVTPAQLATTIASDASATDERGSAMSLVERFAPIPALQLREQLGDLAIRMLGDFAIATYRDEAHLMLGTTPVTKAFRITEVFAWRDGTWQTVAFHETAIPLRAVVHGEPVLDDYIGSYELFPGAVYKAVRSGDHLTFGMSEMNELIPEGPDSFVLDHWPYRIVFVREQGKVTRVRIVEYPGVEYEARRI